MGAGATPAGWYPDVERPGGERYWNGSSWTEDRRAAGETAPPPGFGETSPFDQPGQAPGGATPPGGAAPGQQPGQPPGQQPYGQQPGYGQPGQAYGQGIPPTPQGYQPYGVYNRPVYTTKSNAGVALALAIAGFVCCGLLAIPGMVMGRNEMKAIDAGHADPANRGMAKAAFIVGVIAVSLMVVGVILYIAIIAAVGTS